MVSNSIRQVFLIVKTLKLTVVPKYSMCIAIYIHLLLHILQIEFSPKIQEVAECMATVTGAMISTVSEFHRLPELLSKKKSKKPVRLA